MTQPKALNAIDRNLAYPLQFNTGYAILFTNLRKSGPGVSHESHSVSLKTLAVIAAAIGASGFGHATILE